MRRNIIIHMIRHGHIPSHESDVALTAEGWRAARQTGRRLATAIEDGEHVSFLHGPARRARQTAWGMHQGLTEALATSQHIAAQVSAPAQHPGLRNLGLMLDGRLQEAMRLFHDRVRAVYAADPSPENAERLAYHDGFWSADDPIAYWLTHPGPHAEDPEQAAARIRGVIDQLLAAPPSPPGSRRRILCATHSGPMRAFLRQVLGADPGEPEFCESFTVERREDGEVWVVFRGRVVGLRGTQGCSMTGVTRWGAKPSVERCPE